MFQKILIATDFSERARSAYACAVSFAQEFGSKLHLAHVTSPIPAYYYDGINVSLPDETHYESLKERLQNETVLQVFDGMTVTPHLLYDEPAHKELVRFAKDEEMGLIVLSTHGYQGIEHVVLGSFAERVLRYSEVPVLTARAEKASALPKRVLVPWDFSENSESVLPTARVLRKHYGSSFTLLHVVEPRHPVYGGFPSSEYIEERNLEIAQAPETAHLELEKMSEGEWADLSPELEVECGTPCEEIARKAKEIDADLVLMSTHGRTGLKHFLVGSVTEKVVRHAPCPVLTVRPEVILEASKAMAQKETQA